MQSSTVTVIHRNLRNLLRNSTFLGKFSIRFYSLSWSINGVNNFRYGKCGCGAVMKAMKTLVALSILGFLLAACGNPDNPNRKPSSREDYSLCPKAKDSREKMFALVRTFADQQHARLTDRGAEVRHELEELDSYLLKETGGDMVMLTVTKPDHYVISIANISLREKFGLSIVFRGEPSHDTAVDGFLADLGEIWKIEKFEDGRTGVLNDPPC